MKKYIIGHKTCSRIYLADKNKDKLLFDSRSVSSKEYPILNVIAAAAAVLLGIIAIAASLKSGSKSKKTVKLQKKEIKRLQKLCAEAENAKEE